MIKVFILNKNNKIELTKKQLEDLLNEAYWEGQKSNYYWTYTSPNITTTPYTISSNDIATGSITNGNDIATGSITDIATGSITITANGVKK